VLIHHFFQVPYARQRNLFFAGIAVLLCIGEHISMFVYQAEFLGIIGSELDNLIQMLIFFYGFVLGISKLDHIHEERRKRFARNIVILLGVTMPVIVIDTLLRTPFAIPLYPLVYCGSGFVFTYYLVKEPSALSLTQTQPTNNIDGSIENLDEAPETRPASPEQQSGEVPVTLLSDELYQQYLISPREQEVLPLLVQGASNKELSERLFISVSTVKTHLRNIYAKFDVKNRYELLALLKHGDEALVPRSETDEDA
jgi:DNA-binding CsgD family transcriptional regulator